MVTVNLAKALICFMNVCHPALIGDDTIPGEYNLAQRHVLSSGYGGDVLQYKEDSKYVYAIHRVWTAVPSQNRRQKLNSNDPTNRIGVTKGCINVDEKVYDQLVDCCRNAKLVIEKGS